MSFMLLNRDEEEFIILMGKKNESRSDKENGKLKREDIASELNITLEQLNTIIRNLWEWNGTIFLACEGKTLLPLSRSLQFAREIRASREVAKNPDHHARLWMWAKRNRLLAPLIFVVEVAGPPIGLIGGILGVIALIRGC